MHTSSPVPLSTSSPDAADAPSLGTAVITAAGTIELQRRRIYDLEAEVVELSQQIGDIREFANTNARRVAAQNGTITELRDQLNAVGQLSAAQGTKLTEIDDLVRVINEAETAIGAGRKAYREAADRLRQTIGTADEVAIGHECSELSAATTAAYKRRNAAFVSLLKLAGVQLLPESLTRCER